jgi:hypothetical protein
MAWRIDEAVVRGEIDNRERGRVRGLIWFVGREDPVVLDLEGAAWRDVAGRRLVFENPGPKAMDLESLASAQDGVVGDITASRRVKVPELPLDKMGEYYAAKKPWPWHWGNCLYLEWFSQRNGRVVIESAAYELRIEGEASWEMTEAEEETQKEANGRAMMDFMARSDEVVAVERTVESEEESTELDPPPITEAEADVWQARQDLLLDRVQARLQREGESADFGQILDEERARLQRELGEPEPAADWEPGGEERDAWWGAAEAAAAEPDPERQERLKFEHPLVLLASDLFMWLHEQAEVENWVPDDAQAEHPVHELLNATMCVGPKLAGALNRDEWPPDVDFCAHTIVRLKRAHGYVDDAINAAESCQENKLIEPHHLGPMAVKLADLSHEIHQLIHELRELLRERGAGGDPE